MKKKLRSVCSIHAYIIMDLRQMFNSVYTPDNAKTGVNLFIGY